jgi:hypothetical protein
VVGRALWPWCATLDGSTAERDASTRPDRVARPDETPAPARVRRRRRRHRGPQHGHLPRHGGQAHVRLGSGDRAANRTEGIGALFGYLTGLSTGVGYGVAYGLLRRRTGRLPLAVSGTALTAAVMTASNGPMAATGLTDPRTWGVEGWLADLVPHLAYGFAAAAVYDALAE